MSLVELKTISIMDKCSIIKSMVEQKPKLLVVDDELDLRVSIKNYFSRRNFLVFTAENGEGALDAIKENKPDLVLLDMKLTGSMEGKDVLRILREYDKDTKVAIITGDVLDEQEMQEIADLGIVDFLHKPVDIQTLENVIKKVLEHSYPKAVRFEAIKPKQEEPTDTSLRSIAHELSNVTSDIATKCELYILDTEEGLNKNKTEKERLDEAINVIKSVSELTKRLNKLIKDLSSLAKKET